jgi:phage shock protein E
MTYHSGSTQSRPANPGAAGRELILDVRTPEEYAQAHVPGAKNIPVQELQARVAELGANDTPIVVYCRSGARSAAAATLLARAGFARVTDIGAMGNWRRH